MRVVSLFAGIGGFDLGLERAGFTTVAVVEKDANCRRLLAERFPHAKQFDDVQTVGAHNLLPCDVITGGFPCQDLSIAGKRAGLAGERSGLFYHLTRITHELQPAFLLWENVSGLLSSNGGRDFRAVLAELDRIGYHGAWRRFDAQYFGVAQRRRRIFGVFARADIGAARCAEVLSLAEGLRRHPAPSQKAGEGIARPISSCPAGGSGWRADADTADNLLVAPTLGANGKAAGSATQQDAESGALIVFGGNNTNGPIKVATACNAHGGAVGRQDFESETFVTAPLTQNPYADRASEESLLLAFSCKDHGADVGQLAPTLRSMEFDRSHANGGGQIAIAPCLTQNYGKQPDNSDTNAGPAVYPSGNGVRRLTPIECERLQGFPDGWTEGFADGPRYRMLGNAVAVPCAFWIGWRLRACNAPTTLSDSAQPAGQPAATTTNDPTNK